MSISDRDKICEYLNKILYFLICLVSLSCLLSRVFVRNIFVVMVVVLILRLAFSWRSAVAELRKLSPMYILLGILWLSMVVSLCYGGNAGEVFRVNHPNYHVLLGMILGCVTAVAMSVKRQVHMNIKLACLGLFISSVYTIWYALSTGSRGIAFVGGPNSAVIMPAMSIPVLLVFLVSFEWGAWKKVLLCMLLLTTVLAALFTQSRGGCLAALFSSVMILALNVRTHGRKVLRVTLVCVLVGALLMSYGIFAKRAVSIFDMEEQSHVERTLIWHSAWDMFVDHPVMGVGMGNYGREYQQNYILPEAKEPHIASAHNTYLQVMGERGLVGIIPFLAFFAYVLFWGWKNRLYREGQCVLAITMVILLHGMVDNTFLTRQAMTFYWLLLALFVKLRQMERATKLGCDGLLHE